MRVLGFPYFKLLFVIYTDASALGFSAVLMNQYARGKSRAVAYASRILNQSESNYCVTHRMRLAALWTLKYFRDIILCPITVFTDHAAVTELFKGRNLSWRLARWNLTMQEFYPTIKYLPGGPIVLAHSMSKNVPQFCNWTFFLTWARCGLNFRPKQAVSSLYSMTLLVLVPTTLTLLNFPPSGWNLTVTLLLNISVLWIFPPNRTDYVRFFNYFNSKVEHILTHSPFANISLLENFNIQHQLWLS